MYPNKYYVKTIPSQSVLLLHHDAALSSHPIVHSPCTSPAPYYSVHEISAHLKSYVFRKG